jgi:Bacterial protein of unknown function (DUF882)
MAAPRHDSPHARSSGESSSSVVLRSGCWFVCCLVLVCSPGWAHAGASTGSEARTASESPAPRREKKPARPKRAVRAPSWRDYAKPAWRSGYVRLHNPASGRKWTGYVLGPGNKLLAQAERQVRAVLASWRSGTSVPIDPRLTRLIARVSDTFGGRPIRVVGGYREESHATNSHHKHGEAFDFSVDGVPNWAVRDYLKQLPSVGVGFYPNSSFVHADVRKGNAYWVDLAGPGQAPRYVAASALTGSWPRAN